jgi:hypothetical protein
MRRLLVTISFCISTLALSAQCNLEKVAELHGTIVRSSNYNYKVLCRSEKEGTLRMVIDQWIIDKDTSISADIYIEPLSMRCLNTNGHILFKSGADSIDIPLDGATDCQGAGGYLLDGFDLEKGQIGFLSTHRIETIRIYFEEGYADYNLKDQDYFINNLRHFERKLHSYPWFTPVISEITQTEAKVTGRVGCGYEVYFLYDTNKNLYRNRITCIHPGAYRFSGSISHRHLVGLQPDTKYYLCGIAIKNKIQYISPDIKFTTLNKKVQSSNHAP